jgi:hypothetical protein
VNDTIAVVMSSTSAWPVGAAPVCPPGRGQRLVHLGRGRARHGGKHVLVGRIDHVQGAPAAARQAPPM